MEVPKVILSEPERQLIADLNVILTKNQSIEKIIDFFSQLAGTYQEICQPLKIQKPEIFGIHPKISKGEKHLGLPWIMLDFPRCFDKVGGQLAIRSFFWWGNYFSIQLQVSGQYFSSFLNEAPAWLNENDGWYSGVTNDAWDLGLPNTKWIALGESSDAAYENSEQVLKLAKKFPINNWETIGEKYTTAYMALFNLMTSALRLQAGETVL